MNSNTLKQVIAAYRTSSAASVAGMERLMSASSSLRWLQTRSEFQARRSVVPQPQSLVRSRRLTVVPSYFTLECKLSSQQENFISQRNQLEEDLLAFLTPATADDYARRGVRLFLTADGQGGYGLNGDELISVFSLGKSRLGPQLVRDAIARGARRLDCLDANGVLANFYCKMGFVEVARKPWDDQFAPKGWNHERFGRPDLVTMEYKETP